MAHDYVYQPKLDEIAHNTRIFAWRKGEGPAKKFAVGIKTQFGNPPRHGLKHYGGPGDPAFRAADFGELGFWAEFLEPTVAVEGQGSFCTLNTYDKAGFTFGFLQFAAHVADGDFVRWFRRALADVSGADDYFPMLAVKSGRIGRIDRGAFSPLENQSSSRALVDFLNPSGAVIDEAEILNAARLIDWTRRDPGLGHLQVEIGVETFRRLVAAKDKVFGLDGRPDWQCQIVADIYHQGRGTLLAGPDGKLRPDGKIRVRRIKEALEAADPLTALTEVGAGESAFNRQRCTQLKAEIRARISSGVFGSRVYDRASGEFVFPESVPLSAAVPNAVALAVANAVPPAPQPRLCQGSVAAHPPVPGVLNVVRIPQAPFAASDQAAGGDRVLFYVPGNFDKRKPARILWFCHGDGGDPCSNLIRHGAGPFVYQLPHQMDAGDGQTLLIAPRQVPTAPKSGAFADVRNVDAFLAAAIGQLAHMTESSKAELAKSPIVLASYSSGVGQMNTILNSPTVSARLRGGLYLEAILGNCSRANAVAHMSHLSTAAWCVLYGTSGIAAASAGVKASIPANRLVLESGMFQSAPVKPGGVVLFQARHDHNTFVAHALAPYTITAALARMLPVIDAPDVA